MSELLARLYLLEGEGRPIFRRISELSEEIEEAMSRGFTRTQIVLGLRELGIEISVATLSKYLFRIRRLKEGLQNTDLARIAHGDHIVSTERNL